MSTQETIVQLLRFALVGGGVMLFFTGLNWGFGQLVGAQAAFFLAYGPAVGLHFALNKWWTFGCERKDTRRQVSEYLVMVLVTFVIQWLVFTALCTWTTLPPWLSAGAANAAQMIITFLVMQRRIFARPA